MAKASELYRKGFGKTSRIDAWWVQGLLTFVVLSLFIVYATWAAFQGAHYHLGNYLSPFYSPELFGSSPHAIFGPKPEWWPGWLPFSPALIILPFPALFRFTCYYYRGAYYKAFWADPPACAVSEPRKGYTGENGLPLILQNVHRYILYFAIALLFFLWRDVWQALWFEDPVQQMKAVPGMKMTTTHFGIGLGTLVLLLNTTLLTFYTLSCHSFRHLVGGKRNEMSKHRLSFRCWSCVSGLNARHMLFAWTSLFAVMLADLYVRLCSMGIWHDWRIV